MICPKCGAILRDGASRCFDCGTSFNQSADNDMSSLKGVFNVDTSVKEQVYNRRRFAREPLGRFRTCQIIMLIGYVLLIALLIYMISVIKGAFIGDDISTDNLNSLNTFATILALGVIVVAIVSIMALSKLRDCNYSFDLAFKFLIARIVYQTVYNLIDDNISSTGLLLVLTIVKMVIGLFYVYYFCQGAAELCMPEAPQIAKRWNMVWKVVLGVQVAAAFYSIFLVIRINSLTSNLSNYQSLVDAVVDALTFLQRIVIAATLVDVVISLVMVKFTGDTIEVLNTISEPESQQNDQSALF